MKKYVYVLIETEVSKDCPDGNSYCEVFRNFSDAHERMKVFYDSEIVKREDLIESAEFEGYGAYGRTKDGTVLQWSITEEEIR